MEKIWLCDKSYLLSYLTRMENASAEEMTAAFNEFGDKPNPAILTIEDDKAIITISGPLSRKGPSPIDRFFGFGGTSFDDIIESAEIIKEHDEIKEVILKMDTPGGEVAGVDKTAQALTELATVKFVRAENHGRIASAGVWLAVTAHEIIAMEQAAFTGSIGVVITAIDTTKFFENHGIKIVEIVSRNAPKKRIDIKTKAGRDILQEKADAIERQFIQRVAEGRGATEEHVREKFGHGDMIIALDLDPDKDDATSVGLIDGVFEKDEEVVNALP